MIETQSSANEAFAMIGTQSSANEAFAVK